MRKIRGNTVGTTISPEKLADKIGVGGGGTTDAAPAGFGLGEFAAAGATDCNELTKNGWYSTTATALNRPLFGDDVSECVILVISSGATVLQIGFNDIYAGKFPLVRSYIDNSWSEWKEVIVGENIYDWLNDYITRGDLDAEINYVCENLFGHTCDNNNPHRLKAYQIGAAPAGYGYGEQLPVLSGTTDEINAGILSLMLEIPEPYYTRQFKCQNPVAGGGHMYGTIYKQNNKNAVIVLHQLALGYEMVGQYSQGEWQPWEWVNPPYATNVVYRTTDRINSKPLYKKMDSSGALNYSVDYAKAEDGTETGTWHKYSNMMCAAPSGYGLGEKNAPSVRWDSATQNGFYRANTDSPDGNWWWGISTNQYSGFNAQIAFSNIEGNVVEARRLRDNSVWNVWEYVNPPMVEGVEYRTTERFNGKPVYVKLINCGTLPDSSTKSLVFNVATNILDLVRIDGYIQNNADYTDKVPVSQATNVDFRVKYDSQLIINTNTNYSDWSAIVAVYYTLDE